MVVMVLLHVVVVMVACSYHVVIGIMLIASCAWHGIWWMT
jgi:hypothetical protein